MFWTTAAYAMAPANQGAGGASGFADLGVIIMMIAIFYFLLIRPQQKKAKQHKAMLLALKRGDKVVTAGGLHGRILDTDGETVTLDLGNSTAVLSRGSVSYVVSPTPKAVEAPVKGKKGESKGVAKAVAEDKAEDKAPAAKDDKGE